MRDWKWCEEKSRLKCFRSFCTCGGGFEVNYEFKLLGSGSDRSDVWNCHVGAI